jgi:enolase
MQHLSVE